MAGIAWMRTGTIAVTNGSKAVTGTDTIWGNGVINPGDMIQLPNGSLGEVEAIASNSNTSLTLKLAYTGASASAQPYAIIRMLPSGNVAAGLAADLQALIQRYGITLDQFVDLLDSTGTVSFSDGTTTLSGLSGLRKVMTDIGLRAPLASPALTGSPTAPTQAATDASSLLATTAHVFSRVQRSGWQTNTAQVCADLDIVDIVGGVQQVTPSTLNNPFGYGIVLTMPRSASDKTFGQIVMTSTGQLHWRFPSNGTITAWNRVQPTASPVFTGSLTADVLRPASYTRATVPAAGSAGRGIIYVSDAAGGASLAWSDGASWTSFKTNAAI